MVTAGPLAPWATALGFPRLYNTEIQLKCHNNSKKEKRGGRGEGSEGGGGEGAKLCRFFVSLEVIL
jgi:hypothetical protein